MTPSFFASSLLLLKVIAQSLAFPNPEACSGVCGYVHDPYVVKRSDGTYFRFATFDEIQIATAPSLDGPWTAQGPALPSGSVIDLPGNMSLWAPDVHLINDTYYLYYAVSTGGSQNSAIGVATSSSMESGTWTDYGSLGIPQSPDYNLIDPNLLIVNYGASYQLSFGSFWNDFYQIEMEDPMTINKDAALIHLVYNSTAPHSVEGSFQFWWPTNGVVFYYVFFSQGACCNTPPNLPPPGEEYHIMVCRSESPTGGLYDQDGIDCLTGNGGTLVLGSHDDVYAPGGQGVFYDPANGIVLYYHYVNPSIGYNSTDFQFGWNYMMFDEDGWPVIS